MTRKLARSLQPMLLGLVLWGLSFSVSGQQKRVVHWQATPELQQSTCSRLLVRFLQGRGFHLSPQPPDSKNSRIVHLLWIDRQHIVIQKQTYRQRFRLFPAPENAWYCARAIVTFLDLFLDTYLAPFSGQAHQVQLQTRSHPIPSSSLPSQQQPTRSVLEQPHHRSYSATWTRSHAEVKQVKSRRAKALRKRKVASATQTPEVTAVLPRVPIPHRSNPTENRQPTLSPPPARPSTRVSIPVTKRIVPKRRVAIRSQIPIPRLVQPVPPPSILRRWGAGMELSALFTVPTQQGVPTGAALAFWGSFWNWRASLSQSFEWIVGSPEQTTLCFLQTGLLFGTPRFPSSFVLQGSLEAGMMLDIFYSARQSASKWWYRFAGQISATGYWRWSDSWSMTLRVAFQLSPQQFQLTLRSDPIFILENWRISLLWGLHWRWL